ncbi:MAG: hypothetical protein AVDCRST_MAG68-2057 [uncultured Gemmatimonadetes bacterium]|uniref:Uncharacterized protein n=1 Tax=uncultured Gemmatimonadota bacterium TaxID=203437 RepID=A0A6J4L2W9_9BACT|nr:MAG: hypothetical protein AVDCRST_MAG68-2057 [uncultured Gemmatimonadota bacterium]
MADYERGDTARLNLKVHDKAGALTDPATLTLTVRTPAGIPTTFTSPAAPIVKTEVGVYHADVALTETGTWLYQWETTSPGVVEGGTLLVVSAPIDAARYPAWLPDQHDVAALMFTRAMGEQGGQPSFATRPSPAQVEEQIRMAWLLLAPAIGRDVPEAWQPTARQVVKLQTALLLEPGFWPEQQRDAVREAWDQWERMLDRFLTMLLEGLARDRDDGTGGTGEPVSRRSITSVLLTRDLEPLL